MRVLEDWQLDGKKTHCVTGPDMCDLLALSPAALSDLKKRGIAVHVGRDSYDLEKTVTAYVQHLRSVASGRSVEEHTIQHRAERARLAKEQADAQALKNARARGELVEAREVEHRWADLLRKVRARILSTPPRLRQVLNLDAKSAEVIDRELRDALSELGHADD